jgi:hypothetical protein
MRLSCLILVVFLVLLACKKENDFVKATISDETIPLSGCGWVVVTDSESFSAQNLPDAYQVDGLKVEIKYEVLAGEIHCPMHTEGMNEIFINDIRSLND